MGPVCIYVEIFVLVRTITPRVLVINLDIEELQEAALKDELKTIKGTDPHATMSHLQKSTCQNISLKYVLASTFLCRIFCIINRYLYLDQRA